MTAKFAQSTPMPVATTLTVTPPAGSGRRVAVLAAQITATTATFAATGLSTLTYAASVLPYNEDGWVVGPPGQALTITGAGTYNVTVS